MPVDFIGLARCRGDVVAELIALSSGIPIADGHSLQNSRNKFGLVCSAHLTRWLQVPLLQTLAGCSGGVVSGGSSE